MKKWLSRLNGNQETGFVTRLVISLGIAISLAMGFLDITISILSKPFGDFSISFILTALIVTVIFIFLFYICIWFAGARLLRLQKFPFAFSLVAFIGTLFTLAVLSRLIRPLFVTTELFGLLLFIGISTAISIWTYVATQDGGGQANPKYDLLALCLIAPFILAATMAFIILYVYQLGFRSQLGFRFDMLLSTQSVIIIIGYLLTVSLTIILLFRTHKIITIQKMLYGLAVLIFLSPVVSVLSTQVSPEPIANNTSTDHQLKHVILITVDTLRPDVLSCYGSKAVSTPNIDQLAQNGILFTNAISPAPWTLPSVTSIMTGLSPSVHQATHSRAAVPETLQTLAESMCDNGYKTAAIIKNGFFKPVRNIAQGFEHYDYFPKLDRVSNDSFGCKLLKKLFPGQLLADASTSDLTELAVNWFESNYEKDFFFWLHIYDPHAPFAPPANFQPKTQPPEGLGFNFANVVDIQRGIFYPSFQQRDWIKELYDSEVRFLDQNIGKIIDNLQRLNLYENSLIIFTSDHGEEFWEHGRFEHGHTLYNELLRVPFIIKLPGSASKKEIKKFVSTQNVMPTILELCGINHEFDYLAGESLSPLWENNPDVFEEKPIVSTGLVFYEDKESVIFDGFKYIRSLMTENEELYDLSHDPGEQNSVVSRFPDFVEKGRNFLAIHNKMAFELRARFLTGKQKKAKLDPETIKRLKSLGYL